MSGGESERESGLCHALSFRLPGFACTGASLLFLPLYFPFLFVPSQRLRHPRAVFDGSFNYFRCAVLGCAFFRAFSTNLNHFWCPVLCVKVTTDDVCLIDVSIVRAVG